VKRNGREEREREKSTCVKLPIERKSEINEERMPRTKRNEK
jgi:hypothetical protein